MDCIIGVLIGLIIMFFIHFSVQMISFGVPEQIQNLKKLFGPKYRIRKNKEGFYYAEERTIFGYVYCIYSSSRNIKNVESYIQDEINGKHKSGPDEIIEVNISTASTVTIKE